jgi:hypothetical protein
VPSHRSVETVRTSVHGTERVLELALQKQGEPAFDGLGPM